MEVYDDGEDDQQRNDDKEDDEKKDWRMNKMTKNIIRRGLEDDKDDETDDKERNGGR